jgi:hypothetical protein
MRKTLLGLLAIVAFLAYSQAAKADAVTFSIAEGGQGLPASTSPYATGSLMLMSSGGSCTAADKCIQVTVTASSGYFLWGQTGDGMVGFNDSSDSAVVISSCSLTGCNTGTISPGSYAFAGIGTYEFAVGNSLTTGGNGLCYNPGPPAVNGCNDTTQSVTFDVQDPSNPFSSVSQLEVQGSASYDFGAHICEQSGTSSDCAETSHPSGSGLQPPEHSFAGGSVTPEPASIFLFGSGLLVLGSIFRRKLLRG